MPQKQKNLKPLVIADSSPLIALGILDVFAVLPTLAKAVWIPETVRKECLIKTNAPGSHAIAAAIDEGLIQVKPDQPSDDVIQRLNLCLDPGESQAIYLAKKMNAWLLIDEKLGRATARQMNIAITGSLALLIQAKQTGLLTELKPAF